MEVCCFGAFIYVMESDVCREVVYDFLHWISTYEYDHGNTSASRVQSGQSELRCYFQPGCAVMKCKLLDDMKTSSLSRLLKQITNLFYYVPSFIITNN